MGLIEDINKDIKKNKGQRIKMWQLLVILLIVFPLAKYLTDDELAFRIQVWVQFHAWFVQVVIGLGMFVFMYYMIKFIMEKADFGGK